MSNVDVAAREIIEALLLLPNPTHDDANRFKNRIAAKYHLDHVLSNSEIINVLKPQEKQKLIPILRRKNTRTISGVTVVAVMTQPHQCPQPEPCAYCPGGPNTGSPQSYTGHEPAAMRGNQNNYDPYEQVKSRVDQLTAIGHKVDKIELIIMGGTFPSTSIEYQTWFIKRCLDAITQKNSSTLEDAKRNAEQSKIRNVGITVETRPDWAKQPHIDAMLEMGVTRVELGVQNPNDALYKKVGRLHTVADVQEATQMLKDAGLKIVYHLMPGMPGSNLENDLESFRNIFANPVYKPDMIKIYPCLVIDKTKTYKWYQEGLYKPYSTEEAVDLISNIKKYLPLWVRVMRVQRDIPARLIIDGVKKSNLRQLAQQRLAEEGKRCRCIRCREVGHRQLVDGIKPNLDNISISSITYEASEGKEIFISAEDQENDILIGYLRLRIPSIKAHRPEINKVPSAIVRELHVYGPLVPVGKRSSGAWQHKGYGTVLLKEAERIAKEEYQVEKLLIISALGTKKYYMRFGYRHDGPYVSKIL
jgi:elongator complex protein 3